MALPYGRYSAILMSGLLSLHPVKSFERKSPESVPQVTSRQVERGRKGECLCVSERQYDIHREREREWGGSGGCQAEKAAADIVKRTSLLFNYRLCRLERARSTSRAEGHRQPGASQDMIRTIIKAKTRRAKDSIITTWIYHSQNVSFRWGRYKLRL